MLILYARAVPQAADPEPATRAGLIAGAVARSLEAGGLQLVKNRQQALFMTFGTASVALAVGVFMLLDARRGFWP